MKSPTTQKLTNYRFHPFIVELTPEARVRLAISLRTKLKSLRVVPITDWVKGQKGYDPSYAKAVAPMLTHERLNAAMVSLPKSRRH